MGWVCDPELLQWLSSPENAPVRYLTARDLVEPRPSDAALKKLRAAALAWEPLRQVLDLQLDDGSFPYRQKTPTAQPTFSALWLMHRCGMEIEDEPVARAVGYLTERHLVKGGLSFTTGASGSLPCYIGITVAALVRMGGFDTDLVQTSLRWLVDHQRFDHNAARAGGDEVWPYKAPTNYGCWDSVSCFHGVAGAFQGFAAVPPAQRSPAVDQRLDQAIGYLRAHHLYKRSSGDRPIVRHMTQFFLVGDYRSDLLDMLQGIADADPSLIDEDWVAAAVADMEALTSDGRVPLVKNYGRKVMDPIPFEPVGEPSRFLTHQWLAIRRTFGLR
jgi:hypothetical protein